VGGSKSKEELGSTDYSPLGNLDDGPASASPCLERAERVVSKTLGWWSGVFRRSNRFPQCFGTAVAQLFPEGWRGLQLVGGQQQQPYFILLFLDISGHGWTPDA
jgi:hypothetical protein